MKELYLKWTNMLCVCLVALALALPAFAEDKATAPEAAPAATAPAAPEAAAPAAAAPAAPAPEIVADPSGANTGVASDAVGASANAPSQEDLDKGAKTEPLAAKVADVAGHNRISINMVWTLVCGFLVMFMQAGFAMAETGFTRAKNAGHTMAMNFMVYGLGLLGYWICGFALQMGGVGGVAALGGAKTLNSEFVLHLFGKDFGLFGMKGFFLTGDTYDAAIFTLFLFQMVFMDTTATIPTGSMAERWNMKSFFIYGFFVSGVIYPLYANWVWGGGWLSQLGNMFGLGHGHVDFAGSSVVHMTGGVCALAGAMVIGPRIGKFNKDGSPNPIPGHHIPMAVAGCFILAFGWFGFNAGSTLSGTDLRIGVIATNTMLAGAGGAVSSWVFMWMRYGKPDISMSANGLLAGLVGITAPCAFVTAPAAVLIGAIAGVLCTVSVFFFERVMKIDDPVGAISVHGVNGAWGVLALGLFADGKYGDGWNGVKGPVTGLFYGDSGQFIAQCIGTLTNIVYVFIISWVFFKILDKVVGLRVPKDLELEGLDQAEVAVSAYPDFNLRHLPLGGGYYPHKSENDK
ncbi:ammonium transporter [Geotalea uraniireducens]|uniref:Ammonium transporter n=1 Tax=Geotalea uraniireducens TaxID=351604 RepID=A0ABM8EJ51_9BACT|nr:ammonium transporter [Geotalea uraniireducens]BDV42029.1 ammonium transporter [Geotalea uraniireducens]